MKWFVDVLPEGETREFVLGPFATELEAQSNQQAYKTDNPAATVSDPVERQDDYIETLPRVTSIYTFGGVNYQRWSDGTTEVVS